jgi:hypothetical protein
MNETIKEMWERTKANANENGDLMNAEMAFYRGVQQAFLMSHTMKELDDESYHRIMQSRWEETIAYFKKLYGISSEREQ